MNPLWLLLFNKNYFQGGDIMLTIKHLVDKLQLELVASQQNIEKVVEGVYIGDLLSWVMAHIEKNDAWITIQTNINIIAVALLGEASCIIIVEDAEIDEDTCIKANEEGIPLLKTHLTAYELAIKINELLEKKS